MVNGRKPKVKTTKPTKKPARTQTKSRTKTALVVAAVPVVEQPEKATSAQHTFKRMKRSMSYLGIGKRADHPALMLMSMHYALAMKAYAEMDSLTRDDENGVTRKHPLLQVIRDSSEMFKSYAAEFGMTPVSRERMTTREVELDPFDAFMKEKAL